MTDLLLALGISVAGALSLLFSARALWRRRHARSLGRLWAADTDGSPVLRSEQFGLVGRPDVLRELPDGRLVPVEIKSRSAPPWGPYRSHVVQLWSYSLLSEEVTGAPPPFGVLRYADREFRVAWDGPARAELLSVLRAVRAPYDGRATPSPGRCRACAWAAICDVRAN